jgi:hypothetical protein
MYFTLVFIIFQCFVSFLMSSSRFLETNILMVLLFLPGWEIAHVSQFTMLEMDISHRVCENLSTLESSWSFVLGKGIKQLCVYVCVHPHACICVCLCVYMHVCTCLPVCMGVEFQQDSLWKLEILNTVFVPIFIFSLSLH